MAGRCKTVSCLVITKVESYREARQPSRYWTTFNGLFTMITESVAYVGGRSQRTGAK